MLRKIYTLHLNMDQLPLYYYILHDFQDSLNNTNSNQRSIYSHTSFSLSLYLFVLKYNVYNTIKKLYYQISIP